MTERAIDRMVEWLEKEKYATKIQQRMDVIQLMFEVSEVMGRVYYNGGLPAVERELMYMMEGK